MKCEKMRRGNEETIIEKCWKKIEKGKWEERRMERTEFYNINGRDLKALEEIRMGESNFEVEIIEG